MDNLNKRSPKNKSSEPYFIDQVISYLNEESDTATESSESSETLLIEKEKEKTKRIKNSYLFFGIIILTFLVALFFMLAKGGKGGFEIDMASGKISFNVDKPIIEQVNTQKKSFKTPDGKTVSYTTGSISKRNVHTNKGYRDKSFSPKSFSGKNLINYEGGYVVSSSDPDMWKVQYNSEGLTDHRTPINSFTAQDGSYMNINRESISKPNIQDYINSILKPMVDEYLIKRYLDISYADDKKSAFLTYKNLATSGQSCMKVMKGSSNYYTATTHYNPEKTNYNIKEKLLALIADFTIIE